MIYRPKNKKKYTFTKFIFFIFIFLLILRFYNNTFVTSLFNHPVNYILNSTHKISEPFKHFILYFKDKDDLQIRITQLEKENLELRLNQIIQQSNIQEFEYFINTFGVQRQQGELFQVVARPPFMSFDLLRIVGDLERYTINDLVFYKNILIGKIIEKNNTSAIVQLFSSPDQKVPVLVKGSQFESFGLGGGRYVFEVSKDFEISESDVILFAEQQNFVLGVVEFVEDNSDDVFKKIFFNTPVPLSNISYVSINNNQVYEQQSSNSN